ncbi:MAG: ATP-dependent RecD-like DNA helicase, partial [Desulfatiglandales bacterium]
MGQKFYLTAPTGRAAKRMSELSGEEAKTVHRLLGWNPETGTFLHNERNPLKCNVIIVDEASMLDIVLFSHLLRALPETTRVVLVGDKDQLPPVGPGSPFMELVEDNRIRSIRLTKVYRQKEEGLLILNAHRIKEGLFPVLRERGTKDFLFIHEEDPNRAYHWAIELLTKRIPEEYNLDPMEEIQLLSPMRKGLLGVESLTFGVQEALKGRLLPMDSFLGYRVGDKVMQLKNDYEKDVYNGDIGRVTSIEEGGRVRVSFYGREVSYDMADLDDLSLAYCISVHKSQGSEYPAVILTLSTSHFPLLQRNLLYTAITRAKRLAVIVGTKKALAMAIRNDKPFQRYTALSSWL